MSGADLVYKKASEAGCCAKNREQYKYDEL